jgi:dolichol-phosphate mannosyltransferase
MSASISIVIPFLNESENIPALLTRLNNFCKTQSQFQWEVVFVDDGSTDESVKLIQNTASFDFRAKIISLSQNYGSHAALRAGLQQATGTWITFLYADLQDPPELILRLHNECLQGNEIVWGVRNSTQNGFFERLFSQTYAWLMQRFATPVYPKHGFDIVMFHVTIREILCKQPEAHSSLFLQILTLGFKQSFIRYDKEERKRGKSKWTLAKKVKLLIDSFVAFSYAPVRLVSLVGILMFVIGLLWSGYLVFRAIFLQDLSSGWPTLMSVLLLGFGLTNISLGILAEYMWRIFDVARKRPVFIVDKVIELPNPNV